MVPARALAGPADLDAAEGYRRRTARGHLKDLSDILDPPNGAKRGFDQRMQRMTEMVEALISRDGRWPRVRREPGDRLRCIQDEYRLEQGVPSTRRTR
jgi:hypothetical protein